MADDTITSLVSAPEIPQFVLDSIRAAAEKCGFCKADGDLTIKAKTCNSGDGFIGQMFRATVEQKGSRKLDLICKIPPLCPARREHFDASPMFEREVWFYAKILPAFEEFQRKHLIDSLEGFSAVPRCYVAYYESMNQGTALIMEDLMVPGFRMYDKLVPLDYDHTKLVMTQLGRLHALSFAMKREDPVKFDAIKAADTIAPMLRESGYFQFMFEYSFGLALEIPGLEKSERNAIVQLKDNIFEEMDRCLDMDKAEPYVAIGHSDCWINNFMFNYDKVESLDEENGRIVVRFALGGNQESLNEYLLQLVSKAEYSKYSKVLNSVKYEEYKNRKPITSTTIKEEKPEERKIKREPSDSPPPKPQSSRADRQNEVERKHQKDHRSHSYSLSPSREERHIRKDRRDDRYDRDSRQIGERDDRRRERRSRSCEELQDRRLGHANSKDGSEERIDRGRSRHHHKSSTRTSSGTKKKSHKYKQRRDHSRERARSSDEDDRHHKKKTKKSKKQRSRSRSRR